MKKLTDEQIKQLQAPLNPLAISKHPTKTYLSSIKAIYVVERINEVFGIGAWNLKSEIIKDSTAMIVVKATLTIPEYGIELESFGGNDNGGETNKNFDLGDAYKGATTDALTKIGSYLEIGIDVFKGLHDNKANQVQPVYTPKATPQAPTKPVEPVDQRKLMIVDLCKKLGFTGKNASEYEEYIFVETMYALKEENYNTIIKLLETKLSNI